MLMTTNGLLRVPLDLSPTGILLVENLLPALSVSVVNIGAHIPSVEFCVIICILVMTGVTTMEMGIFANISIVYTQYNTINKRI